MREVREGGRSGGEGEGGREGGRDGNQGTHTYHTHYLESYSYSLELY